MTLAPVVLDDLTWDQMVEAIRRRIPAESSGNWTLHAPVDPGITFLDLFAFLAEQRLYWLDQVPDAFVVAVLRTARPGRPAARGARRHGAPDHSVRPGRTRRSSRSRPATGFTRDPRGEVVFTLDDPVTVLPVRSLTLEAGGQDRTADLLAGPGVDLLPAGGGAGEATHPARSRRRRYRTGSCRCCSTWPIREAPRAPRRHAIPPAWSPERVDGVPPPAQLSWA